MNNQNKATITITENSIGRAIFFTIATLGIYGIYWQYKLMKNIRAITKSPKRCLGEMLLFYFVPFYSLYWWYTRGKFVRKEFSSHSLDASSNGLKCLLFSLLAWIIPASIMQSDFNSMPTSRTDVALPAKPGKKMFQKVVFHTEKHTYEIYGVKNAAEIKTVIENKVKQAKG